MQHEERKVPSGAIAAALDIVEALHGRDGGLSPSEGVAEMMRSLKIWGSAAVTEAFGTIIFVAAQRLQPALDDPDPTSLRMRTVAAVMTKLQANIPEVTTDHLPITAGFLTAAFLGIGPYEWRVSFGPVEPGEDLAWCYAAWLLVDLVDSNTEHPGGFAEILRSVLTSDG